MPTSEKQINDLVEYWAKQTGKSTDNAVVESIKKFRVGETKLAMEKVKNCIRTSSMHGYGNDGMIKVFEKTAEWRLKCG